MRIAVIGAGWSGLTFAYLAQHDHHNVTVFEKRDHIGGNAYDEIRDGQIVPKYGAHIFHTRSRRVWEFVNQFSGFNDYVHRVKVFYRGEYYDYPITPRNIERLGIDDQLYRNEFSETNFENVMLNRLGPTLYEIFVASYTRKMWGRPPSELSPELAGRVSLRLDNDTRLFTDPYQGMPNHGYRWLFSNMAQDLEIVLGIDAVLAVKGYDHYVVTSAIDEWYDCDLGKLEYRGMRFERTVCSGVSEYIQTAGTINLNSEPEILRSEEPKQYYQQNGNQSVIVFNYPSAGGMFYPVPTRENEALADKYRARAARERNVTFIGRLGQYRYLNQDQAILMAMQAYERING